MNCVFLENSKKMLLILKQNNKLRDLLLFKSFHWFAAIIHMFLQNLYDWHYACTIIVFLFETLDVWEFSMEYLKQLIIWILS